MKKALDNRELSWLKFNGRVLEEATDTSVPLCERLLFCQIFQSNLDEFFMIRAGSLYDRTLIDNRNVDNKTGMTPAEQLRAIYKKVHEMIPTVETAYADTMSHLDAAGVEHVELAKITDREEEYLHAYFNSEIRPIISPQVVDKRHPFPFLSNKAIYAVTHLESKNGVKLGIIPAGGSFPRMIILPDKSRLRFVLAEDVILRYCSDVFENYKILGKAVIRITRNADINLEEGLYDRDADYRRVMEELLKKRRKLSPVRLELYGNLGAEGIKHLCRNLDLTEEKIFFTAAPLDLSFIFTIRNRIERAHPEFFYDPQTPQRPRDVIHGMPLLPQVLKHDVLLSYPYESIRPFIGLLNEAGNDPEVISIKITLYRVASNSKVIEALISAAENGKEVFVLVELRARFDEENNIEWSRRLERAGCKVMYGPEGLKVHSKLLLITRKNGRELQYITQIGTGNYNEKTSELYTDLSLITADSRIGLEAGVVFNALSLGNPVENCKYLMAAPKSLQNKVIELIDREIAEAQSGREGYIGLKLNSVTDKTLINKLIEASAAGVKVDMVVRGICCLIAGIEGQSENITVRSIVGRYLEHSRIYIFGCSERQKVYISSADFMTRNTLRRVEIAAPVHSPELRERILEMFDILMRDNVKARIQAPDGTYHKVQPGEHEKRICAQEYFAREAKRFAEEASLKKPVPVKVTAVKKVKLQKKSRRNVIKLRARRK
ncbi:MAG: polyphosphate kinase 1 [Oscillospiraceae bacterium]|nr:polyphosphate kinase 1 [Oscillospiraceae bacterium]